ncbi:patatin-like phospholipase family protein [Mangrovitalea sediminis]|uniref:patatin-like phospholipase family protein n=1 Tax=Mangrovitalea sediminis TaxID=1982043 RepID=UPI000BE5070B|nr:patatin-like phospholipase family protein [Mangrovitalea sediminis]
MTVVQVKEPALTIRAGTRALAHLRRQGLQPGDVHLIPGAAGGPKALGIQGLDLAIFGQWLPRVPQVRTLIGASIGSWRFASLSMSDPVAGIRRLGELYSIQRFPRDSDHAEVSRRSRIMLDDLLQGEDEGIVSNPHYRLGILINRSRGLLAADSRGRLGAGLVGVMAANLIHRRLLGGFLERVLVAPSGHEMPLAPLNDFTTHRVALTAQNLRQALLASASIPMVMSGVTGVAGAPPGVYRDGGLLDYHLDLPYRTPGVILYPHFTDRVIPGWFDKPLRWRQGDPGRLADVLLVSPSAEYLHRLPHRKLPDRKDFTHYLNDDDGREAYWRRAMAESERLGDEFLELVDSGRLLDRVQPL